MNNSIIPFATNTKSQSEIVNPLSGAQKLARDLAALTQRSNFNNLERAIIQLTVRIVHSMNFNLTECNSVAWRTQQPHRKKEHHFKAFHSYTSVFLPVRQGLFREAMIVA